MAGDIDRLLRHPVWRSTNLSRLIPLADSARELDVATDEVLFRRFHPAQDFYLLSAGEIAHETEDDASAIPTDSVSWPWAAIGWSGFLSPQRYTTTARATGPVRLLAWRHDDLATCFYADPGIAIAFLKVVVDSVWCQLEAARVARLAAVPASDIAAAMRAPSGEPSTRRFVPSALSILRRSAFYEQFDDSSLIIAGRICDAQPFRCRRSHLLPGRAASRRARSRARHGVELLRGSAARTSDGVSLPFDLRIGHRRCRRASFGRDDAGRVDSRCKLSVRALLDIGRCDRRAPAA
jgi:CRP-like cAMP-binding protein